MPNTPSTPPRRRSVGIRRPRVAGRVAAGRPGSAEPARPAADERSGAESSVDTLAPPRTHLDAPPEDATVDLVKVPTPPAEDPSADPTGAGPARPSGKRRLRKDRGVAAAAVRRPRRTVPTVVLAAALVVLTAAAVFLGVANALTRGTPAAQNTALTDVGATAQVTQQLTDALKAVYSFDFTRLDQNEAAARAVITPDFKTQFDQLFGQVRQLAPQQQAVVTATVASSAVREIDGDTAVMVVFLDQQATRAQSGGAPQQLAAAGRLTVTGKFVDGRWKISDVRAD